MMKFFRKYNKHLLAVFMALLLIVWLADDAIRAILKPDDTREKIAMMYGSVVRQHDLIPTYQDVEVLTALGIPWRYVWYETMQEALMGMSPPPSAMNREGLQDVEWFMLVEEANRQHIAVPPELVDEIKTRAGVERLEFIRDRYHIPLHQIDRVISDYLRVREAAMQAASAVMVSEPEIYRLVKQTTEKVRVEFAVLPASSFIDAQAPLKPEDVAAFFEKYKDFAPGAGPDLGYGYQRPPAVQVEYVTVDVNALAKQIELTEDTVYRYWRDHKTEFMRPPPPGTNPATRPTTQPTPMPFNEAKPRVIEKLQKERAKQEALKIARELLDQMLKAWGTPPTGKGGYPVAPPEVRDDKFLSAQVDSMQKLRPNVALRYHRTGWLTQSEAMREPGIGFASIAGAKPPVSFSQAVMQVEGLVAEKPAADKPGAEHYLALYQPCPAFLTDFQGNAYVYRVVAARPAGPPASVDEVRAAVERDLREAKAYKEAESQARALYQEAVRIGLPAAFEANAALRTKLGEAFGKLHTPEPFARADFGQMGGPDITVPVSVPPIGSDEKFIRECFRLAEEATAESRPATATAPNAQHILAVVDLNRTKRYVVVQWLENLPIREDEYGKARLRAAFMLRSQEVAEFVKNYYSPEQIRERVQWKDLIPTRAAQAAAG